MPEIDGVPAFQEASHGVGHDYVRGSPHLKHPHLRTWIDEEVCRAVRAVHTPQRPARVLEVGAGHGSLTEVIAGAGAHVVVTEMSRPSAEVLRARFAGDHAVTVVLDADGAVPVDGRFDFVVYVSVLHHIPDYLSAIESAIRRLRPGGSFLSFQDPLWYPRQPRRTRWAARALYLSWRLGQGDLGRGATAALRRARGVFDPSEPSDMVEYHVMRDGVDEQAIEELLAERFASVDVKRYFSTQGTWAQRLGERCCRPNTFGVVATGYGQ